MAKKSEKAQETAPGAAPAVDQIRLVIFRNKKKQEPGHPDYTGKITQGEKVLRYVSLWAQRSKAGEVYLSGVVNPTQEVQEEDLPF